MKKRSKVEWLDAITDAAIRWHRLRVKARVTGNPHRITGTQLDRALDRISKSVDGFDVAAKEVDEHMRRWRAQSAASTKGWRTRKGAAS